MNRQTQYILCGVGHVVDCSEHRCDQRSDCNAKQRLPLDQDAGKNDVDQSFTIGSPVCLLQMISCKQDPRDQNSAGRCNKLIEKLRQDIQF